MPMLHQTREEDGCEIQLTDQEKKADKLFPRPTPRVKEMGHGALDTVIKYQPKEKQSLWSENIPNRDEAAQLSISGKNNCAHH
ncbi:hypothetical protein MASR1M31_08670 [Porphyromonadaceae bacterium]